MKNKNSSTTKMPVHVILLLQVTVFTFILIAGTLFTATAQNSSRAQQPVTVQQNAMDQNASQSKLKQSESTIAPSSSELKVIDLPSQNAVIDKKTGDKKSGGQLAKSAKSIKGTSEVRTASQATETETGTVAPVQINK